MLKRMLKRVIDTFWWVLWFVWLAHALFVSVLAAVLVVEGLLWAWRRWVGGAKPSADSDERMRRLYGTSEDVDLLDVTDKFRTVSEEVTVRRMPRGEDSLFQAVSHQLRWGATGVSVEPWDVRHRVARLVNDNFAEYRDAVLGSIADLGDRYAGLQSEDERILQYLMHSHLPGHPPGRETLQAVADVFEVDVHVYREGGAQVQLASRPHLATASIGLGLRMLHDPDGVARSHYDSVVSSRSLDGTTDEPRVIFYIQEDAVAGKSPILDGTFHTAVANEEVQQDSPMLRQLDTTSHSAPVKPITPKPEARIKPK